MLNAIIKIPQPLPSLARRCLIFILRVLNRRGSVEHRIGHLSILLPMEHKLPEYQRSHIKYDRFLPHLAKHIPSGETVVDVGANCGDTLAAMFDSNNALSFICIEPDDSFFEFLESNISRMRKKDPAVAITTVKSLVGQHITDVSLKGGGGSKHAAFVADGALHRSRTLDSILADMKCSSVRLLKTDVDGFDYDVIDSALLLLRTCHPIVFFECQCDFEYQKAGYEKTIASLQALEYCNWVVFDNFGEIILQTEDTAQIFHLLRYVWNQNINLTTRTIYYYDILAFTERDASLIGPVLSGYQMLS